MKFRSSILLFFWILLSCSSKVEQKSQIMKKHVKNESVKDAVVHKDIIELEIAKEKVLKYKKINDLSILVSLNSRSSRPYYEILPYAYFLEKDIDDGEILITIFYGIINLSLKDTKPSRFNDIEDYNIADKNDFLLALSYLERGAELNHWKCIIALEAIYRTGSGVKKDVKKANEYKKRIDASMPDFDVKEIN